ncbi:MAG: hypothetical protein FJY76_04265 [Candidatus Aenigmarchaeota archaeon]|nr:hypothetical protein [Candidatus Aenigmarchaeota archaeon]
MASAKPGAGDDAPVQQAYRVGMRRREGGGAEYVLTINGDRCVRCRTTDALVDACLLSTHEPINDGAGCEPLDAPVYDDMLRRWRLAKKGDFRAEV